MGKNSRGCFIVDDIPFGKYRYLLYSQGRKVLMELSPLLPILLSSFERR